jgi:DNA-binding beta-propeller fold protein YncE
MRGSVSGVRASSWLLVVLVACCVMGLVVSPAIASGGGSSSIAEPGSSVSLLGSPLVVVGSPVEEEQVQAQEQARRHSPQAVADRRASDTEFQSLSVGQVAALAAKAFPALIKQRAGGSPILPVGERITGYLRPNVARLAISDGRHGVIESAGAMAKETSRGRFTPIDLGLKESRGDFVPVNSNVAVQIPKRLGEGVKMSGVGVSLTPVDAQGAVLGGSEGAVDGSSVIFPSTQPGIDTVAKPTSVGFEISAILRSVNSPRQLYDRVGVPGGGSLVQRRLGGAVQVLDDGVVVATVFPPSAKDAAGTPVPVVMGLDGDLLTLEVSGDAEEYQYPIEVDPELAKAEDRSLTGGVFPVEEYKGGTNWLPIHSSGFSEEHTYTKSYKCGPEDWEWCEQSWYIEPNREYNGGEYAGLQYETQGESKAYKLEAWMEGENEPSQTTTQIEFNTHHGESQTNHTVISSGLKQERYKKEPATICAEPSSCEPSAAPAGNVARIMDYTTKHESIYGFWTWIWAARVYVAQEKGPETSFNTSSTTIGGAGNKQNVLYGSGGWLGPNSGAYEVVAHDPGIGVSFAALDGPELVNEKFIRNQEGDCLGIQCSESYSSPVTYTTGLPNGNDSIKFYAEDAAGLYGDSYQTIKIDAAKPYNLNVSGWPKNLEISAARHSLTVEATDGTKPTPSSGVRSIAVSVDGGQGTVVSGGSCSPGECTASGKYTLNAEGLGEGVHRLVVTATDNAANEAAKEYTFDVRHGTPVSVGPGTVDPSTGQFTLSATDVSLGGTTGVSRTYQSRNLTAGAEGPLGPQWAISLGAGESLVELPDGSVALVSSTGGRTTFTRNEKGEFESPLGDGNLKIEAKEPVKGKGITEYWLVDASEGTTTKFTQPTGTSSTTPVYTNQFGTEGTQLNHPLGVATDSNGNVWVADYMNNRVLKFSRAGTLVASYGSYGSWQGQFMNPREIAINQSNGDVYVTDEGNNRVVELNSSGEFLKTFGWGVSDGKAEFEICTSYCRAGVAGTGNGQLHEPRGITIDSSGDVWVADAGNDRLEEFEASGKYMYMFGKKGSGEVQFESPMGMVFSGGYLYVAEWGNNRVQKLSTGGKYEGQFGKSGSGNGEFNQPRGIAADPINGNLYVADTGNNRVQEFSPAGTFIAKFSSAGTAPGQLSEPKGVAVSPYGGVYVADYNNARVEEWTRPTWLPTVIEDTGSAGTTNYSYQAVEVEGKTVIEPLEVTTPTPAGVSCGTKPEELKKGCRALTFEYAKEKSAKGEGPSEWGSYVGHLNRVEFHGWDPSKGAMTKEVFVAQYEYDLKGRLRAEWDPRISPVLKKTYGYDEEEYVTAVSSAGQEPWLLHHGALAGDPNTGRLLSVTRPAASSKEVLKEQSKMAAPVNTEKPTLSGTSPEIGILLKATSEGKWSNSPLAYSYQWEDCHLVVEPESTVCLPIAGAVNQSYTPQASDAGFKLVVQVTAENSAGAKTVASVETKAVPMPVPSYSKSFGSVGTENGKFKSPAGVAVDTEGDIWVADLANNRVQKLSPTGSSIGAYAPDSMSEPEGIAFNSVNNDVYVTSRARDRIDVLSSSGTLVGVFGGEGSGVGELKSPDQLAIDARGDVWVDDTGNNRIEEFSPAGVYMSSFGSEGSGHGQFKGPTGIAVCNETLYVTDQGNERIQRFSLEGKWISEFSHEFSFPSQIACESVGGDIYVSDKSNNRIEEFNATGAFLETFSGSGETQLSTPIGVAVAPGGVIYASDYGNSRIEKWTSNYSTSNPAPAPPSVGTGSVSTIEYHVPLSGVTGLQNLSKGEVAKWGQKDDPEEGMAVFAPDEPMGWPAKEYKRASIVYMDEQARTVNTASPSGAVSTSEYNETNDVVRTLSPDNRATALKETTESAQIAKANELDSESVYNAEGTELLETLGPEHKVKLTNGSEVQARDHVKYSYDEGAPEGKEHDGLVTKTTDAALVSGKEEDLRTTITSYAGQKGLGWTLRKPTSVTTDPTGLDLTKTIEYDENTGNVIETKAPGGSSVTVSPPEFSLAFGKEGSGNGLFKHPTDVATDGSGNVWVNDRENGRVQKFSASGSFIGAYGSKGSGAYQFEGAWDIAVNQTTGNVYVGDSGNNRIDELNSSGAFVETIGWGVSDGKTELEVCKSSCKYGLPGSGNGQLNYPLGITIDSHGDILVADDNNSRVEEFSEAGAYLSQFGSKGTGNGQFTEPDGLAISEGEIYVVDHGNKRVEEFSPNGAYLNQFGSEGSGTGQFKEPTEIAVNPNNPDIYVADESENRVEEFSPAGKFLAEFGMWGTGPGQFQGSAGLAVNAGGDIYVSENYGDRVDEWVPPGAGGAHMLYSTQFGSAGSGSEQFNHPVMTAIDGEGDVWVTDFNNARVKKFSAQGKFLASYGSYGSGEGQFEAPTGIAINQGTGNAYVADCENSRIEELSSTGGYVRAFGSYGSEAGKLECPQGVKIDSSGDVWVADNHNDRIEEFNSSGGFLEVIGWGVSDGKTELEVCKSGCKAGIAGSGNGQFSDPNDIAISGSDLYVADSGNHRIQELSTSGAYLAQFGSRGNGGGQFDYPESIATDASGHLYVVDYGNERVQELSASGQFLTSFGSIGSGDGQLNGPRGIAINSAGDAYVADTENNRIEIWAPSNQAVHDTQTIYYSTAPNSTYPSCGEHPEWADLVCQTQPGGQPEDGINLPVSTFKYNLWEEIETTTETFGTTKRTKAQTYDPAGRALTSETTSTIDTVLPKVTNEYNTETGALETQSTTEKGETKTITSKLNTLGQLASYTDADKNTTTFGYETSGDDRLTEVNDGKGTQTYAYDPTTGFLDKLVDSAAGTSRAGYDVEGKMLTETYPNGMTATNTLNPLGQTIGLTYEKNVHCATKCPETWFSDTIVPSIHGETLAQTSTLAKDNYNHDNAGRLTQTQEEPTGEACVTRIYAYDEESNRTSLTTRKGSEGKCATEGGTVERHTYDPANRLTDPSTVYETFGNTTTLPAADAGGKYEITSSYYVDNQIASQTQNEKTLNYHYDPAGRARETETIVKGKTESTVISHYSGAGEALTWINEGSGKWSRNIPGIDGALDAIQTSSGTTTLQLHDLQGNIIATASTSETETKLLSTYNSTEFGVPNEGKTPPKYGWLGATGVSTELSTGVATKGGASYVPQIARNLQTEPITPPGAFPNGIGGGTPYTATVSAASMASAQAEATQIFEEIEAARQAAARRKAEEACESAPMSCVILGDPAPKIDYLTFREATLKAFEIRTLISLGDEVSIESLFFDLSGAAEEAVEGLFTGEADKKWDEFVAGKLEYCVNELESWGATGGGCRVSTPTVEILGGSVCFLHHCVSVPGVALPDLSKDPEVSMCGEWVDGRLGECIYLGPGYG